jgi:putative hemin transport protein
VHEKVGRFEEVSVGPAHGLVLGPDIDLRIFHNKWAYGWAVESETPRGMMRSLQFFDAHGTAVHKVYLKDTGDLDAYVRLVGDHAAGPDAEAPTFTAPPARAADRPDEAVDVPAFRDAWRGMQDTHEFFGMLQKHKVGRQQALRLAGGELAYPVATSAFRHALEAARDGGTDIMIFVSSPGCVQIHTGPISTIKEMGPWLNVLDPGFNLHLRADHLAAAWVVRKPTSDGIVSSLEIFDPAGDPIALMFGKRKPGDPEMTAWRSIVAGLPEIEAAA